MFAAWSSRVAGFAKCKNDLKRNGTLIMPPLHPTTWSGLAERYMHTLKNSKKKVLNRRHFTATLQTPVLLQDKPTHVTRMSSAQTLLDVRWESTWTLWGLLLVLYSTLCVCHHLIHCLPGSGDDCTQNRCTVLAQTKQALCDIICSLMNTINVIENGRAGKYASYAKQHPLGGRSKRLVLPTHDQRHLGQWWWSQYWRIDLSIEWRQPCCRQNHSFCLSPVQMYPEQVSWEWPSLNHSYCVDRST